MKTAQEDNQHSEVQARSRKRKEEPEGSRKAERRGSREAESGIARTDHEPGEIRFSIVLGSRIEPKRRGSAAELARSSEEERRVDARALIADEGRDKLRKAAGSCK